jgi:DNA-binding transcriptional MerR regulator
MRDLDINEVARRAGVPASTLRFYEEKGLIASIGRRGLRRLFDPGVLERLALIALARTSGFSLDEIARMFAPDGRPRIDRRMLAAKAEELDQTIRELTRHARRPAARGGLSRAELYGMPHLPAPPAGRRVRSVRSAKEASSAVTVELVFAWLKPPSRSRLAPTSRRPAASGRSAAAACARNAHCSA